MTREDVQAIYDAVLNGAMSKEEAAEWAYNAVSDNEAIDDKLVEDALYSLISYHDIGMIFAQYRPGDDQLTAIRDRLAGSTVGEKEVNGGYYPEMVY